MIDVTLWRVYILSSILRLFEYAPSKSNNLAGQCMYRKHNTPTKTVNHIIVAFDGQSRFDQILFPESVFLGILSKSIPLFETVTQLKFLDYIIPESPFFKIRQSYGFSFRMIMKGTHKIITGMIIQNKKTFSFVISILLVFSQFLLLNLYIIFLTQIL